MQWVLGTTNAIETIKVTASKTSAFARALTAACSVCSIVYDRASGGAEHCQMGAQSLRHTDLFDWIARIDLATTDRSGVN